MMTKAPRNWWVLPVVLTILMGTYAYLTYRTNTELKEVPTQACNMRLVLDRTYTATNNCWVVLECPESFESLFQSKHMSECVEFLNNQR